MDTGRASESEGTRTSVMAFVFPCTSRNLDNRLFAILCFCVLFVFYFMFISIETR